MLFTDIVYCHIQVGAERYNLFTGCPKAKTATMVLRGGSEQFIDEAERSLHDAIMIVRRAMKNASVVPGGGAIDMEISKYVCCHSASAFVATRVHSYQTALNACMTHAKHMCSPADRSGVFMLLRLWCEVEWPSWCATDF